MYRHISGILLWLAVSTLCMTGCEQDNAPLTEEKPLRPVRTMVVSVADTTNSHEFTAVVDAARKADLSFKISGEIITMNIKQGDRVVAGQVLAKLDDKDIKIQLKEAQSSYDKAKSDFDRARKLIKSNTISKADFDQVKAQHNSALAILDGTKNNLSYTSLKSPFKGVIAKKYSENFQEVNAKQPVFALHDLSSINLKIDVPESIMINTRQNDTPPNLSASFDAIPEVSFPLKFKEVATQPDEVTKTYEATLSMEKPKNHTILPGMTARVVAELSIPDNISPKFYLPANVVLKNSSGNFVYSVVDNKDGSGTIVMKTVTIGEISQLGIEIFSGIAEGEHIVTAGMSKVSDGLRVKF